MRHATILSQAFEDFRKSTDNRWRQTLLHKIYNNGLTRDELEVIADFCELAAEVITTARETIKS